jgi:hypothetical protein
MIAATVVIWPLKHSQETHTSLPAAPFSPPLPVVKKRSHALPLSPWLDYMSCIIIVHMSRRLWPGPSLFLLPFLSITLKMVMMMMI